MANRAPVAQRTELLTSDQMVGGSNPSGRASSWLRFAPTVRFSPLTRLVKPPGMRVRFPLGLSVESDARDLSLAESCARDLRSQMPVSSLPSSQLESGNVLDRQIANSPAAYSAGVIGRIRHPVRLAATAWAMHRGEATIE
jgi:hypothetical protein